MKSAMTSSPLRVAIIGAGQVADKVHASYYCTRNDLELVAVITAAIAASTNSSTDSLVVRSIKRAPGAKWKRA